MLSTKKSEINSAADSSYHSDGAYKTLSRGTMVQSDTDFRQLVETCQHKVYNQAYRMLGNREEAEEATQDIFLKVHAALDDFRGEASLSSWIYRITANVCISRMRRKQLQTSSLDQPRGEDGRSVAEVTADESDNPEEKCASSEMGRIVREQFRRLKPEWAQALSLHYFGGQSYGEVAAAMAIPRATVATYIRRSKLQLAGRLVAHTGKDGVYLK